MRNANSILWMLLIASGALLACGQGEQQTGEAGSSAESPASYTDITHEQLNEMMSAKDFVLLNVHIPYEGDIPGTDDGTPSAGVQVASLRLI